MTWDEILSWIAAAGGIGTAAMGFVQALKAFRLPGWGGIGTFGLGTVRRHLGPQALAALDDVYGEGGRGVMLRGAWNQGADAMSKTLRNGLRMAVFADLDSTRAFVGAFGQSAKRVSEAVRTLRAGTADDDEMAAARECVARLEAAIDARVGAAVAAGRDTYASVMQLIASVVAVGSCLLVWSTMGRPRPIPFGAALVVGLLAVPVAPVAKDAVGLLSSVRSSLKKRQPGA